MHKKIVVALLAFGLVATAGAATADAGITSAEDTEHADADEADDGEGPCEIHTHFGEWKGFHYRYPHPHCV